MLRCDTRIARGREGWSALEGGSNRIRVAGFPSARSNGLFRHRAPARRLSGKDDNRTDHPKNITSVCEPLRTREGSLGDAQQLASRRDHWALPAIAFRVKRSHPRFRRRPLADLAAPRPPTPQILETVSTRPALETRRRTLSWIEGWPRSQGRGARGNGNARSPSPQVASLVFGRRPSRINSAVKSN